PAPPPSSPLPPYPPLFRSGLQFPRPLGAFPEPYGRLCAQSRGAQHQTRLRRQPGDELLLHRGERLPVALLNDENPEHLVGVAHRDRKSTRLNSSHVSISYA